jgi:hypothetical protein
MRQKPHLSGRSWDALARAKVASVGNSLSTLEPHAKPGAALLGTEKAPL